MESNIIHIWGEVVKTEQIVYADVLFMIDFSMDFLTFYIVSHILKKKMKLIRVCSAAAMGGVYSVISLGIGVSHFFGIFFDIFVCFVMCMTAFLEKSSKQLKKMPLYTVVYFTVSAMLGGVMTAIFSLLNKTSLRDGSYGGREELSLWVFGFVALLSGLATFLGSDVIGRSGRAKFGKLTVKVGSRKMTFDAMSDSGNMLKDPIGGRDVVVVDRGRALSLIPSLAAGDVTMLKPEEAKKIRLIPVKTAAGEGVLTAFLPDEAILDFKGEKKRIDVLIALSKAKSLDGRVEAIISADYFI